MTYWCSVAYWAWALPFVAFAIFEEAGWRGFLLPHLQTKYSAFQASTVLAGIWAFWHAPFFLFRFDFSLFISIGFFFGLFVGSIIMTSIYNFSRGSLMPVLVFHLANNAASAFNQEFLVAVVSAGFVFLATRIVKKFGREDLSFLKKQTIV
ncbi:MAG: CPBP family intramembrane glutamic endopeptidase [Bacteroidota bacterium]